LGARRFNVGARFFLLPRNGYFSQFTLKSAKHGLI